MQLCSLEQIAFFGSFDEIKMHQLCYFITIGVSKHMQSKKGVPPLLGCRTNICDLSWKKRRFVLIH